MIPEGINIDPERVKPGMKIIVSGSLGDHAIAVMGSRYELALPPTIKTDCAPLNHMVWAVLEAVGNKVAVMRDPRAVVSLQRCMKLPVRRMWGFV